MSASSSSQPSYDDLSIIYESALLNYQKLDKQVPKENRITKEYACQALSARVDLLRAVQCVATAAMTSLHDDNNTGVGAAQALLEQTTLDLDEDALEQVRAMETLLPSTINDDDNNKTPRLPLQTVDVDVNAFFEAYPECAKTTYENDSSSSSSDSEDSEEQDSKRRHDRQRRKKERTKHASDNNGSSSSSAAATGTRNEQPPATSYNHKNPYAKQTSRQHQQQSSTDNGPFPYASTGSDEHTAMHRVDQQQPQQHASRLPIHQQKSWGEPNRGYPPQPPFVGQQQQQPQQHQSSWEDHNRGQNPFQTAREYAWAASEPATNHPYNNTVEATQQQQQPPPRGSCYTINNPYAPPAPPERPAIRESLKRKFQPPNKREGGENSTQRVGTATTNPPRKLGLAGGARANTATMATKSHTAASSKDNNDQEDDDLPEELKRFGKELVEKIESEIMDYGDPVTFHDIAGLDDAKQTVQEVVCWPMKRPDLFTGLRQAPNGLLLYGPPGTGKTLIGKAIAHESGATFFSISSSSLTSKWIGEGEKLVRVMFAVAAVRQPAVVFIDEIDSLLTQRKSDENEASRRIKTEFLVQLDGTGTSGQGRVLVIGATNRPQELDEAARRRFTKRLYIPLPEERDREILLRVLLEKNNHRLVDEEIKKLAKDTAGYSGADLKSLSTDAAMGPIRELGAKALDVDVQDVPPITYKHFRRALRAMKPSVAPSDLDQYIEWDETYGTKRAELECDDDDDMSEASPEK